MNYKKHYNLLIERAKTRVLKGYSEKHHIIPKCLDGTNDKSNLVKLTPEEHFVAHLLLVKIYPGNKSMIYAVHRMTSGTKYQNRKNNKMYGWIRKKFSETRSLDQKKYKHSEETLQKMRRPKPKGFGAKVSKGKKGKPNGTKGKPKSEAFKKSVSLSNHKNPRTPRPVHCIELNMDFETLVEAATYVNLKCTRDITDAIYNRNHRKTAKGYTWRFIKKD